MAGRTRKDRHRQALGAIVILAIATALTPGYATAREPDPVVFGAPDRISAESAEAEALNGISCPSLALCVAVDSDGEAITSSELRAERPRWSIAAIDTDRGAGGAPKGVFLNAISCPVEKLCVAVDVSGRVVTTTRPTGGAAAWTVAEVDGSNNIRGISCPTRRLCVGVDDAGNVITSTNPTAGPRAWTVAHIPATRHLTDVSCPTPDLCVATAEAPHGGNLIISTNPTGGPRSWAVLTRISPHAFQSVSCPSIHLCVATDLAGYLTSAARPLGGRRAWSSAHVDRTTVGRYQGFIIPAVACVSTTFCIAVDDVGKAISSTRPTAGVSAWSITKRPDSTRPFRGVACPSSKLCIAIDEHALLTIHR
jgi:hypothetical protein